MSDQFIALQSAEYRFEQAPALVLDLLSTHRIVSRAPNVIGSISKVPSVACDKFNDAVASWSCFGQLSIMDEIHLFALCVMMSPGALGFIGTAYAKCTGLPPLAR